MKEYAVKNGGEYIVTEDDEISKFNEEQAESLYLFVLFSKHVEEIQK